MRLSSIKSPIQKQYQAKPVKPLPVPLPPELPSHRPMSLVCSVGPIYAIRSTSLLPVSSLPVSSLFLLHRVQKSFPPAFRTLLVQRGSIRTAIVSQRLLFIRLIIPIVARGVELSDGKAFDDFLLLVAANDPEDCTPHAHPYAACFA
jgi:hypothetical protein